MTNELEPHSEENGEVSYIGYGDEDMTIITCAWDKTIKIHMDTTQSRDDNKKQASSINEGKRHDKKNPKNKEGESNVSSNFNYFMTLNVILGYPR